MRTHRALVRTLVWPQATQMQPWRGFSSIQQMRSLRDTTFVLRLCPSTSTRDGTCIKRGSADRSKTRADPLRWERTGQIMRARPWEHACAGRVVQFQVGGLRWSKKGNCKSFIAPTIHYFIPGWYVVVVGGM